MEQTFRFAVSLGLYSVVIDKNWEVPVFQFFMGDLANFIPGAAKFVPDSPFYGACKWNQENSSLPSLKPFEDRQLSAEVPVTCSFSHNSNKFMIMNFTMFLVVQVIPESESLIFVINSAEAVYLKYQ